MSEGLFASRFAIGWLENGVLHKKSLKNETTITTSHPLFIWTDFITYPLALLWPSPSRLYRGGNPAFSLGWLWGLFYSSTKTNQEGGGALYGDLLTFYQPPSLAAIKFSNWFLKSQGLWELRVCVNLKSSEQCRSINKKPSVPPVKPYKNGNLAWCRELFSMY